MLAKELSLEEVVDAFVVNRYLPEVSDLEEGLRGEQLRKQFGPEGQGLQEELEKIEQRVLALPIYQ